MLQPDALPPARLRCKDLVLPKLAVIIRGVPTPLPNDSRQNERHSGARRLELERITPDLYRKCSALEDAVLRLSESTADHEIWCSYGSSTRRRFESPGLDQTRLRCISPSQSAISF